MGKNQAYKAMQRSRLGSASAGPDEIEDGMVRTLSYYLLRSSFYFFLLGFADFALLLLNFGVDLSRIFHFICDIELFWRFMFSLAE